MYKEAVDCLDRAIEINPGYAEALCNKGDALRRMDLNEQSLACLDRAVEIDPGYTKAWYSRGLAFMALGRCVEADEAFLQAGKIEAEKGRSRL